MNETLYALLIAVAVVAGIGLLIGLILSVASVVMAVPKNKKAEAVLDVLPGANCGACGYSGCSGYAEALAAGEAEVGLCAPGGEKCAKEIAAVLGVEAGSLEKKTAVVRCNGSFDNTSYKAEYFGLKSCAAAVKIGGGLTSCSFGCLGLGDCEKACPYDAIHVKNGVAQVDPDACKACSLCVKTCPRGIIELAPVKDMALVRCSNRDKGGVTRKLCTAGCIGCKKCEKTCPIGAVKVTDFCAYVDPQACVGCGACVRECPQKCITYFDAELVTV